MIPQRRYPGVRPFETADQRLFFGRDRDIRDLGILLALEKLVVLFGKSGYGKSSLINAGLIPNMHQQTQYDESRFIPILVRLGSYIPESSFSPLDHLLTKLNEVAPEPRGKFFLDSTLPAKPLWYRFKKRQQAARQSFLLVFDQFEEFFTYPPGQQEDFNLQLQEMLYTDMPQRVRERLPEYDRGQRQLLADSLEVKVLFSIRSDRLNLLHAMGAVFPAILDKRSRYELKGLSRAQAEDAIRNPAQQTGDFDAPAFRYTDEALRAMLDKLGESKYQPDSPEIEAFQLQILCEYLEGEVIRGVIPDRLIEPGHFIGKIDAIYEGYYQRLLDRLPAHLENSAQQLIEESLIFEDERTGEVRRLSVDADVLVQRYSGMGITHATLRELENTFLLRREPNSVGSFSYEVSHDTLLGAILSQKHLRETEADERRKIDEERARRKKEYRQRVRLAGSTALAILGFALAAFAWQISLEAERQRNLAEAATKEALAAKEKAEDLLEKYEMAKKVGSANELVATADGYFRLGKYDLALENYRKALELDPDNTAIKNQIEKCLRNLRK